MERHWQPCETPSHRAPPLLERSREEITVRTLLIDNHDAFTYNLDQYLAARNGQTPLVVRNDAMAWEELVARSRTSHPPPLPAGCLPIAFLRSTMCWSRSGSCASMGRCWAIQTVSACLQCSRHWPHRSHHGRALVRRHRRERRAAGHATGPGRVALADRPAAPPRVPRQDASTCRSASSPAASRRRSDHLDGRGPSPNGASGSALFFGGWHRGRPRVRGFSDPGHLS